MKAVHLEMRAAARDVCKSGCFGLGQKVWLVFSVWLRIMVTRFTAVTITSTVLAGALCSWQHGDVLTGPCSNFVADL